MDMLLEQFKVLFDRPEKVKKLRELILQLAVRGKIVPQDENDEPAAVLLEKIREEKERLVKEGNIKKEKPLPEIREDEKPYELPKGWEWVRMNDVVDVRDGTHDSPKYIDTGGYPLVTGKDFYSGKLNFAKTKYISKEDYEKVITRSKVDVGDILYSMIGGNIGSMVLIEDELEIAIKNVALFKRYINRSFEPKYLMFYLKAHLESMKSLSKGGAQAFISLTILRQYLFAIPPLKEQHRIVEKVDSLMAFCDKLEKSLERKVKYSSLSSKSVFNSIGNCTSAQELEENLRFIIENFKDLTIGDGAVKELKNAILQLAVQGKLVPQDPSDEPASVLLEKIQDEKQRLISEGKIKKGKPLPEISEDEKPYELPEGWEICKLGKIAFITKLAGFEYTKYINLKDEGDVPVIRAQNVRMINLDKTNLKYIDLNTSESLERSSLTKKCLLMTFIGAGIGDTAIFDEAIRYHLAPNVAKIEIYGGFTLEKYLLYYLISPDGRRQVFKHLKATAQPSLSMQTIRDINIVLPPLNEQQRIVAKVDLLMSLCDSLEKRIEKTKAYSEKLMEALLKEGLIE